MMDLADHWLGAMALDLITLQAVFLNVPEPTVVLGAAQGEQLPPILYANPAYERLTGYSLPELVGRTFELLRGPGTAALDRGLVQSAIDGRRVASTEILNYRKDGSPYWVEASIAPIDGPAGERWIISIERDVTGRREEQERLRRDGERLSFALDGANDGLWDWDVATGRVWFSPRWEGMLGYWPGELEGHVRTWEVLIHPDDRDAVMAAVDEVLAGRSALYETEHRLRAKTGEWVWILDRGKVVERDAEGRPLRAVGTHTDITARRRLLDDLTAAMERAVIADRTKSQFLATMSHELRTPLNAIIGFSELLLMMPDAIPRERDRQYVADILSSGQHLLDLLSDLLDLSNIELDRVVINPEPVSVGVVLRQCMTLIAGRADKARVAIAYPRDSEGPVVHSDHLRLKQILLNLLSNAVKFTPAGGRVEVRVSQEDGAVRIDVADTGIGMRPEDIPRAFDSFVQLDNEANRRYEGSGLGLPLARRLTELLGGRLTLKSRPSEGTTATVTLPELPDWDLAALADAG